MTASRIAQGVLVLALALAGCTANEPFRTSYAPFDNDDPDHSKCVIEAHTDPAYKLGVVEFDDQGAFFSPRQLLRVEDMIRDEAGLTHGQQPRGIVLVAFVHGWKDNADAGGDGIAAFRNALAMLSAAERASNKNRPVVGVYAGWRGLSSTWEPFKELSFWSRKEAAHRVGGYGAMTELLVDLENIQKQSLAALAGPSGTSADRTDYIIIGHSFGAAAVYSAVAQVIVERFATTLRQPSEGQRRTTQPTTRPDRLKPLGDQVILLNPAFEAQRHFDLDQLARAVKAFPPDQRPVLTIFTSRGDWATHYCFPLGRWFSTAFDADRDGEATAGRDAVGWHQPFITHDLTMRQTPDAIATAAQDANRQTGKKIAPPDQRRLKDSVANVSRIPKSWTSLPELTFDQTVLTPRRNYKVGDPIVVVSVDRPIMRDHSDINNPVLLNFLREYVQFTQTGPGTPPK